MKINLIYMILASLFSWQLLSMDSLEEGMRGSIDDFMADWVNSYQDAKSADSENEPIYNLDLSKVKPEPEKNISIKPEPTHVISEPELKWPTGFIKEEERKFTPENYAEYKFLQLEFVKKYSSLFFRIAWSQACHLSNE